MKDSKRSQARNQSQHDQRLSCKPHELPRSLIKKEQDDWMDELYKKYGEKNPHKKH